MIITHVVQNGERSWKVVEIGKEKAQAQEAAARIEETGGCFR